MTKDEYIKSVWRGFLLNVCMNNSTDSLVKTIDDKAPFAVGEYEVKPIDDLHSVIELPLDGGNFEINVEFRKAKAKPELNYLVINKIS